MKFWLPMQLSFRLLTIRKRHEKTIFLKRQISRYQVDGVRLPPQGKSQDGMILVRDGKTDVFFLGDQ